LRAITIRNVAGLSDASEYGMQVMSRHVIQFYSTKDAYGDFSNFAAFPIEIDGQTWPTSEHYFQAQKFAGTEHEELIRVTPSPMTVAKLGRDRKRPLRADWEEVKDSIMRKAVWAKFTQHPRLAAMLVGTGDAEIVEHTENDAYWGDGGDGKGLNRLGEILMQVREAILQERKGLAPN
jgi:N-glycosidase YbiA